MILTCNFINTNHIPAIEQFMQSLVSKTFGDTNEIGSVVIDLKLENSLQAPWNCVIRLNDTDRVYKAEAWAANHLTAFSQALKRLKKYWDKQGEGLRA